MGIFPLEVIAAVLGTAWAWCLTAFALGWWARGWREALGKGVGALVVAVVVYYVCDAAWGLTDGLSLAEIGWWATVSLVVGPAWALLGRAARRVHGWPGLALGLLMPLTIVVLPRSGGSDHIHPWPDAVAWVVAAGLAVALVVRQLVRRPAR